MDEHSKSELFLNAINALIMEALKTLPLTELEQERIQKQVADFLRPRWLHFQDQMLQQQAKVTQPTSPTKQNKEQSKESSVDTTPMVSRVNSPSGTPTKKTVTVSQQQLAEAAQVTAAKNKSRAEIEAEVRVLVAEEAKAKAQARETNMALANRVATFLTATTGIEHRPSSQAVLKIISPDRSIVLGPNIVASYKTAVEEWEAKKAKEPAATAPPPNQQQTPVGQYQMAAPAPYGPNPYYPAYPPPPPPPAYYYPPGR